jgi:hypothetical protein
MKTKPSSKKRQPKVGANSVSQTVSGEVLKPEQAAAFLQLPVETVCSEATAGRLPGRNIRGEWRFSRTGIVFWLSSTAGSSQQKLTDFPVPDETPEEQEAFIESLRQYRDEVNRLTGFGKYATP